MVESTTHFRDINHETQVRVRPGRSSVDIGYVMQVKVVNQLRTHLKLLKSKIRSSSGLPERGTNNCPARFPTTFPPVNSNIVTVPTVVGSVSTPPLPSKRMLYGETAKLKGLSEERLPPESAYIPQHGGFSSETLIQQEKTPSSKFEQLIKCDRCSRSFREDIIEKHSLICAKNQNVNRPKFDSKTHRLAGIQAGGKPVLSPFAASSGSQIKNVPVEDKIPIKRPSWRDKSDQLRAAIGAARSSDPRDKLRYEQELARVNQQCLTKCEYCGRSFNADAAARHIPICRSKAQMMPRKPPARPIEKTVAEVTSRVLAKSAVVVPLAASNRTRPVPR